MGVIPAQRTIYAIFSSVIGLLLGDYARASATPSKWPTETAHAVAMGHRDGVVWGLTLEQLHR